MSDMVTVSWQDAAERWSKAYKEKALECIDLCDKIADLRGMLMNQSEQRAKAEREAADAHAVKKDRDAMREYIHAANQFAWAHERSCPRHSSDAACDCGLDSFLSKPRPFINSYKEDVERLRKAIAAADCSPYCASTGGWRAAGPCNCWKAKALAPEVAEHA